MCRAAATTTHSVRVFFCYYLAIDHTFYFVYMYFQAVVGSALSTPALASLALMQDKTVISRAAISRVALYELLQTKITTHMENLAREILQLPLETATTKLNLVFSAWTVLNEYSDLEIPSSVLDCVRTLARKLPELLSGTALTTMERGGLGEMLHQIQVSLFFPICCDILFYSTVTYTCTPFSSCTKGSCQSCFEPLRSSRGRQYRFLEQPSRQIVNPLSTGQRNH